MSTPRDRYMNSTYNGCGDHTAGIDPDDIEYEDSVSSDTHYEDEQEFEIAAENAWLRAAEYHPEAREDFDNSDPYDIEYDIGPAVFEML